jgi:predicted  nucleic acid-binding Zn-ribbon protein
MVKLPFIGAFSTVKLVLYGIGFLAVAGIVLNIYLTYQELDKIKIENGALRSDLAVASRAIDTLETNIENINITLEKRDEQLSDLREELDNITVDLGSDSNDLAPESLRELIRRLGGEQNNGLE